MVLRAQTERRADNWGCLSYESGGAGVGRRRDPFESLTSRESSAAKQQVLYRWERLDCRSALSALTACSHPNGMIAVVTSRNSELFLREGDQLYDVEWKRS